MANVDIAKKYSNFTAPRTQIFVNEQDIREKYGIAVSSAVIEEASGSKAKFSFSIDDPKCQWIKSEFFTLNSLVQIRMGYENTLETVINGEIASVKSIFPARGPPQIEVSGDTNEAHAAARPVNNSSSYSLAYGRTLYSFTSTTNAEEEKIIHKASTTKVQTTTCIALPSALDFPILSLRRWLF